ncbi:hypothetical protein H072_8372 [Dactylellina haptotyla CBS 200.50]|uniref:ATP25 mRNA stabilisation domain-containing protein n=1 Tax=Dactylellina haptotyla (strain CBS 200.50) TaxID=1284197 RepID=S8A4A6_DACHA|nr:hypothetical protein H072_8372 [Dactylellina haptotyla CBS 200.50]
MSVTPRLLRRASQRLFSSPSPFPTKTGTVCIKCRLLARQNIHTYRRRPTTLPALSSCGAQVLQKRTFLDLFKEELKQTMQKPIENVPQNPGIAVMSALVLFVDDKVGFAPTTSELVKAFQVLASDKRIYNILRDEGNCYGLLRLLEALSQRGDIKLIKDSDLISILNGLESADHEMAVSLAGTVLEYIRRTRESNTVLLRAGFEAVIATLANTGDYNKAVGFLKVGAETYEGIIRPKSWWQVLRSIIDKDNEEALLQLTESAEARDPRNLGDEGILTGTLRFYMDRDDTVSAKKWWDQLKEEATTDTFRMIFGYAVGHTDDALAQSWTEELLERTEIEEPESAAEEAGEQLTAKEQLEVMKLKWKMHRGESMDTISALVQDISTRPKIEVVNELVDFAVWKKDGSTAQMLLMLAERWRWQPNRRTQVLKIRTRMLANDPMGAVNAWEDLKYYEDAQDSDAETLELLTLMAANPKTAEPVITNIYNEVLRRDLPLDVDALRALSHWQVFNKPFEVIVQTLSREINNYSYSDRLKVIQFLGEIMGMPKLSVGEMWKIYQAMRDLFPELPMNARRDIMELFFTRDAPDIANLVFMQMRHSKSARPDAATYTAAFRHCARLQDAHTLWSIHLQFKIDPDVKPNTELYNSLMWAYNSVNQPLNSLEVFKTITNTREGPDSDTLSLVMISCGLSKSNMKVRSPKIWSNFLKLGIQPTMHNYAMRLSGWCLADNYDMAFKMLKEMEKKEGMRPNREVFMALYSEYQPSRREELEKWAEENIPEVWDEITKDPSQPLKQYEGQDDVWIKGAPRVLL